MIDLLAQTAEDSTRLEWRGLPESWQAFVAIALVGALIGYVIWSYRKEANSLPAFVRYGLLVLRVVVIGFLITLLFDPVKTDYRTVRRYPTVAVMSDLSQSMETKDPWQDDAIAKPVAEALGMTVEELRASGLTRLQVLRRWISNSEALPEQLREKANVRVMTFGGEVNSVATLPSLADQEQFAPSEVAEEEAEEASEAAEESNERNLAQLTESWAAAGTSSDLTSALQAAMGVNQLRAIYLVTDGQHTGSSKPVELAQRAAELGIPIYAFGLGDPARPRNVSVRDVAVLDQARPNEPFAVDAVISAAEMAGQSLRVELYRVPVNEDGEAGEGQLVESRDVVVQDAAFLARERFSQRITESGRYRFEVRIQAIDGEQDPNDNVRESSPMVVSTERIRILLIAGEPTWEYQNLRKLFERDPGISLTCWLQSLAPERRQEGNEPISVLPRRFEQLAEYNAIMMFDPNPDEFDEAWMDALTQFVERKAGGFMFMAGPRYTADFIGLNRTAKIRELLPVRLESGANAALSTLLQVSSGVPSAETVEANLDHPVMSFAAERAENQRIWNAMPGTYWSFPALSAKPTAKVLLEHQDQTLSLEGENRRPLMVAGRFGAGNTLYLGFPGTWRWRSVGVQAEFYDRFWVQVVSYLTDARSIQGLKRGTVDPDRELYELGDRVELTARLLAPTFEPLVLPEVEGILRSESGVEVPLTFRAVDGQPGQYVTTWRARTVGRYDVSVELPDVVDPTLLENAKFRVEAPSAEAKATWLNEPLLQEICEASGGAYYRMNEVPRALAELSTSFETVEWREPPKPVWDLSPLIRALAFGLPILLLAVEWSVRKWFKLL